MRAPGIYAQHPEMFDLVERRARIVKVADGFLSTAGPVFSRIGFLLFSDLGDEKIYKWTIPVWESEPDGGKLTVFREKSQGACGLTFDHQGRLLTCEQGAGRVTRTEKNGSITVLADRYGGKRLNGPNDLLYNIDGSVYFSDLPRSDVSQRSRIGAQRTNPPAVYRITRTQIPGAGRLERVSQECARPSGLALGPQQDLLYVADGGQKNIRVQPLNDDGTLGQGRVFAEFASDEPSGRFGLKSDELGNVYASGPGGLWIFSPTGKHLGTIVTPEQPSNCCWGRGILGLYITAGTSVYYVATRVPGTRTF